MPRQGVDLDYINSIAWCSSKSSKRRNDYVLMDQFFKSYLELAMKNIGDICEKVCLIQKEICLNVTVKVVRISVCLALFPVLVDFLTTFSMMPVDPWFTRNKPDIAFSTIWFFPLTGLVFGNSGFHLSIPLRYSGAVLTVASQLFLWHPSPTTLQFVYSHWDSRTLTLPFFLDGLSSCTCFCPWGFSPLAYDLIPVAIIKVVSSMYA